MRPVEGRVTRPSSARELRDLPRDGGPEVGHRLAASLGENLVPGR